MKKFLPILTIFIVIVVIITIFLSMSNQKQMVVIHEGNHDKKPIDIKISHFQDTQCGMTIETNEYSAQVVSPEGKTWFFDDVGCMALWFEKIDFKDKAIIWVYSLDTKEWINGRTAWYSRVSQTPMTYGFGAYKKKKEKLITFDEMLLFMLRGENLTDPYVKQKLLGK